MTAALQVGDGAVVPSVRDLAGRVLEHLPVADFTTRLEVRKRARELIELANEEGIKLPMPAGWIARLELHGFVVDLMTGEFGHVLPDSRQDSASAEAWAMRERGEIARGEWGR